MHITEVIKRPILTEKTYSQMDAGKYVFEVAKAANKKQIKNAFQVLFEVKVADVNIVNQRPKEKRLGRYIGKTNHVKKAIITLKAGEKLNLFSDEEESKS